LQLPQEIMKNKDGLSFVWEPVTAVMKNPMGLSFVWEPEPQDDVAKNLDELEKLANELIQQEQQPAESTVEVDIIEQPCTLEVESGKEIFKHKCQLCDYEYISPIVVANHQRSVHPSRCCFFCKKVCISPGNLENYIL
jgi:hypothetical protein